MQLLGLNTKELEDVLQAMGEPAYRGRQVAEWIYRRGATSFDAMTNLSRDLRARLAAQHSLDLPTIAARHHSEDGSTKLLLEMADGERIETVRLPYADRLSVCVSSQAGCAMACAFCATGLGGFRRNLSVAEIIAQPLLAMTIDDLRLTIGENPDSSIVNHQSSIKLPTHIVFMGMGEPLLNLNNVLQVIHLMHGEMGIAMRHITVSTVGILHGMRRLADEKLQLTLAVSLHAPDDELRHRLIPTSMKTRVSDIIEAAKEYVEKTRRRVTFEYVVLGGVNDGPQHACKLAQLCRSWPCHVNLIPWNAVPDAKWEGAIFVPPNPEALKQFRAILEHAGITVTQRVQRGADVAAACGQLRAIEAVS
ncbi:MAG: 23S rRNA (adenine(2503)-C(2))-methyltransferase RlmN [Armatimonadota bacterium]|nr:23S rRNA (adenine(2503)-C(2))-methyltransferase RlmN [Armatimonadota bacterium]